MSKTRSTPRLAAAKLTLAQLQLKHALATLESATPLRRPRNVPKPATGETDAVVTFGTYAVDTLSEEEGYMIGFRALGAQVQASTLLAGLAADDGGPDLAPGDMIRLERVGNRRHKLVRVIRKAAVRRPIDWLESWHGNKIPNVRILAAA